MITRTTRGYNKRAFYYYYILVLFGSRIVCANEYDVYKAITKNYDKNVRPTHNTTKATVVSIELTEFFLMSMIWTDEIAKWNPSAFGGTESVLIPQNLLWRPDIVFPTSLNTDSLIPDDLSLLHVHSNGTVESEAHVLVTNQCILLIEAFPFDEQSCELTISSWMYPIGQIDLINPYKMSDDHDEYYRGNGEWKLISISPFLYNYTWDRGEYIELVYTIVLKRQPIYYICVLLSPTFLTATICLFGLFVPASNTGERIEKVNMGLATMLSMAVILGIVAGEMPKSTTLPLLGFYVLAELLLCTIGVGISMLIMFAHQRATTRILQPPSWLTTIVFFNPEKCLKPEKSFKRSSTERSTASSSKSDRTNDQTESAMNSIYGRRLNQVLEKVDKYFDKKNLEDEIVLHWTVIFDRIDIIFMISFNIVNVIMSGLILLC